MTDVTTAVMASIFCLLSVAFTLDRAMAKPPLEAPRLQAQRLFFTALQREQIDRALPQTPPAADLPESVSASIASSEAAAAEPVSAAPVARSPSRARRPEFSGYLLAPNRPVVWLDGQPLVAGGQLGRRLLRAVSVDGGVVAIRLGDADYQLQLGADEGGGEFSLQVRR